MDARLGLLSTEKSRRSFERRHESCKFSMWPSLVHNGLSVDVVRDGIVGRLFSQYFVVKAHEYHEPSKTTVMSYAPIEEGRICQLNFENHYKYLVPTDLCQTDHAAPESNLANDLPDG